MATLVLLATVVPRLLGPADYGRFSVVLTLVTVVSMALVLGGPMLMARFVPAAPPAQRAALARGLTLHLARRRAAVLAVLAVVTTLLVAWDPERFPPLDSAVVVVALVLNVGATLALQVGLGLGRTGAWSARFALHNGVLVAAVVLLHGVAGAAGALLAIVVSSAATLVFGARSLAALRGGTEPPVTLTPDVRRFGALHAAAAALVQVAHRGGVVAVALLAGSSVETGFAALAIGVALGVSYAVLAAFTVSLPQLVVHGGHGPGADAEAALRRIAWGMLAGLTPALLLATLVLDRAVPAVFGNGYVGARTAFAPALALVVLSPLNALVLQTSALRLRPGAALAAAVAGVVAFAATALATIPAWGAAGGTGAALAGAATSALVSARLLPGAAGAGLVVASLGGGAGVLALALAV